MVIFAQGSVSFQAGVLGGPTIYGHAAAAGARAVAAIYYGEVDANGGLVGGATIDVEGFSSKGGDLPFYFDGSGNPIPGAPELRFKPDLASVDGTNTTFFGSPDTDNPPDGFPNFFGTSAASPHLAALAALFLDRAQDLGQTLTPAEVYTAMRDTAVDIESPGRDPYGGDGLVLADSLLASLCQPIAPDLDGDCDVDGADLAISLDCATAPAVGPPDPGCEAADLDLDNDVDQSDHGLLQRCLSGEGIPPDPNCL
jgi:subtilisin family serine protease